MFRDTCVCVTRKWAVEQFEYSNGLVLLAGTMPSVRSAAFTLLLPAGAAYEEADGLESQRWQRRRWWRNGSPAARGPRDSRELLTALDNLGVSHAENRGRRFTPRWRAQLGTNLEPALEIFADIDLRPHLDDDEVEPIGLCLQNCAASRTTRQQGHLRAAAAAFSRSMGAAVTGDDRGDLPLSPADLVIPHEDVSPQRGNPGVAGEIDWPRLRDTVGRLFGDWKVVPEPRVPERTVGPRRDHIRRETQQIQIALAYPAATVASPGTRARAAVAILGGVLVGPALHGGP